ncbi:MAG TPA: tetratricopeptide repeat protein [Blastocatellia bacterium]|nr:tetratricopeptide repeat protein [Blastocatellia bacterium]
MIESNREAKATLAQARSPLTPFEATGPFFGHSEWSSLDRNDSSDPATMSNDLPATTRRPAPRGPHLAYLLGIATIGTLCYLDSFRGAFVYDDQGLIVNNSTLRHLWPPWPAVFDALNVSRPLIGLSNALNYAISGVNPWSYHALNLAIHILAALALFGIVRRTLTTEALAGQFGENASALAAAVAVIWMVHPLQTQSVTYIIQRCESLMGMFYLVTLYCSIRSFDSSRRRLWYAGAIAACAGGMMSKQVMLTAPLAVLSYDFLFVAGSIREALRRHWRLYVGLAATWAILAATLIAAPANDTAGFAVKSISPWDYLKSEFGVLFYYLRLSLWPNPLCLDYYGWPKARGLAEIIPYAIGVIGTAAATIWLFLRRKPSAFLGVWFFLIISMTSSVMPFSDLVFEHRMYLPLASVVALLVLGGYSLGKRLLGRLKAIRPGTGKRISLALVTVIVALLGCLTVRRNLDYSSGLGMWRDVVRKRPDNARAHNNLGELLAERGAVADALPEFEDAARLDPFYYDAQNNLGLALAQEGKLDEGKEHLLLALRVKPSEPLAHFNLARVLATQGELDSALAECSQAAKLKPDFAEAHIEMGRILDRQGRFAEGMQEYQIARRLDPDWRDAEHHTGEVQK